MNRLHGVIKEIMPEKWYKVILCLIFDKRDIMVTSIYRDILLLNTGYELFTDKREKITIRDQ